MPESTPRLAALPALPRRENGFRVYVAFSMFGQDIMGVFNNEEAAEHAVTDNCPVQAPHEHLNGDVCGIYEFLMNTVRHTR
jgi:hypothetical protein